MFRTQYDEKERVFCNPGSPIKILLKLDFDKKGVAKLVENGKINLYDEIQSHADSVDLHLVLQRYARGDVDVLNKRNGTFGDFTQCPTSFADVLNSVTNAEAEFYKLDTETRARFDNSFAKFYACLDNPALFNQLLFGDKVEKKEAEKTVEKVVEKAPDQE